MEILGETKQNGIPSPENPVEIKSKRIIKENEFNDFISGAKRCNIKKSDWMGDWFVGSGKDESCFLEGTWWDMICLARNILADENTKKCAEEFYKPEWKNNNYLGEEKPYEIIEE